MDRFLKRQYHEIRTEEELMVDDAKMISVMMDLSLGSKFSALQLLGPLSLTPAFLCALYTKQILCKNLINILNNI